MQTVFCTVCWAYVIGSMAGAKANTTYVRVEAYLSDGCKHVSMLCLAIAQMLLLLLAIKQILLQHARSQAAAAACGLHTAFDGFCVS